MVGLNSNFKKVFVTNNNTLLDGTSTNTLADGQIGIFNADTYVADSTPTWTEEKAIMIAQGTPDLSYFPKGAGIANETDKSKAIVGKKITGWRKKAYSAGQANIVTIGWDGVNGNKDTKNMLPGKCDEIKHLYIRLTGKPVEDLFPGGYLLHVQAQGPCCDTCGDNCANVDPTLFRDQFYDRMLETVVLGGIKLFGTGSDGSHYVTLTKLTTTNTAGDPCVGIEFTSAFVDRTSDTCYFDIFPWNAEPVYIEVSEYDPNWHGDRCASNYPVTVIQNATYPFGKGEWLMRYEAEARGWDFMEYSYDLAERRAKGQVLNTVPTNNYDKYTLSFEFTYKVMGWSNQYTDRYDVEVFVATGQTAFKTAINAYIASVTGLGIAGV